ncbi:hypothetical protein SCA03_00860 [Streptomyces cacaoi]|uniref:Uncharacterized protein n=1 Tax=Streptomyces cacaoi TaxID=1898 RepID=A0A4Y3QQG8_STRCI|nr:hypothetical protein SCA03_00860 [Streptomyces cacaoi]
MPLIANLTLSRRDLPVVPSAVPVCRCRVCALLRLSRLLWLLCLLRPPGPLCFRVRRPPGAPAVLVVVPVPA